MIIEFTDEEIKRVNSFEPQTTKTYLNDLLREKIAEVTSSIEITYKRKYCNHPYPNYHRDIDSVKCDDCERVWT